MIILLMAEIRLTSWYGKFPIVHRVLYIPGGAGFLPSTVVWCTKIHMEPADHEFEKENRNQTRFSLGKIVRRSFWRLSKCIGFQDVVAILGSLTQEWSP